MFDTCAGVWYLHGPMTVTAIIPCRRGSTRLKDKPLLDICGKSMMEHVYRRAEMASLVDEVILATDDEEIKRRAEGFGAKVALTPEAKSGTDRVAMVAREIKSEYVINLQGDEPMIPPNMIDEVIAPLIEGEEKMTSLKRASNKTEELTSPNVVKVVTDHNDYALYFSRSPIPYRKSNCNRVRSSFIHVGIYGFKREFLLEFASLEPTPLEESEGLEQLRALENGVRIKVPTTGHFSIGVDTIDDLEKVRKIMRANGLEI